jgi:hypothetical protein
LINRHFSHQQTFDFEDLDGIFKFYQPKPALKKSLSRLGRYTQFLVLGAAVWLGGCTWSDDINSSTIPLPENMLDSEGNTVHSVYVARGSAAILRKIPKAVLSHPPTVDLNVGQLRPAKSIRLGGYFFGGWDNGKLMTQTQLSWISQHLDVLSLNNYYVVPENNYNGGVTPENVAWLKKQNPNFKYYSMVFATTLREPYFDKNTMSTWVIRDKNGKEVLGLRRGHDLDLNHTMDLSNKDYANFFRNFIMEHSNKYHADGVAIDEIMWRGYWDIKLSDMVNFSSVNQITSACYSWLEIIKRDNPKEIIHQAFWPDAQQHSDGVWGESSFHHWFRDDHRYKVFYETMSYQEIIDNMMHIGERGETYIWAAYYNGNNRDELKYTLGTYLLGKKGDYLVYQPQPIYDGGYPQNLGGYDIRTCVSEYENNKDLFDIELGKPEGDYYIEMINDKPIYIRKFSNGIVYVNPND